MKKFVFTSNIKNEEDKDLLNFLAKEAEVGQEETYKCSFLSSLNKENIINKVKSLITFL